MFILQSKQLITKHMRDVHDYCYKLQHDVQGYFLVK